MKVKEVKEKGEKLMKEFTEPLDYNSFINNEEVKAITVNSYYYWTAYSVSQQNPVVYGSYATLTGKEGRFCSVSNGWINTGENFYIVMLTLRVNADGTYSPTSISSVPAPE